MQYFCLHGILPFSKSYPEIESTWPTAKCRGRKSFDTWYYIVTCATLCVSFSSKSKAINIFPKYVRMLSIFFSMVHPYMDLKVWGLDCMKAPSFRVRVIGLVFVSKSASLTLKQVPTCIRKPKTNTFYKSIKFAHWLFLVVLDGFRLF